jgi:hypothetical protein
MRVQPGNDANNPQRKGILNLQPMCVQRAVCRLLAQSIGSLAAIVGSQARLLARNVSRKCPLFASPRLTVCKPLHIVGLVSIKPAQNIQVLPSGQWVGTERGI